ncbi:hypothetical protein Q0Z83_024900 [Actinoplanes sichuanensis]|nr:hypothetical protein Q0Z83_024900 [Actinoplanes sichuanensis]
MSVLRAIPASPAWRTYHALCVTVFGLADSDLREQVQIVFVQSEKVCITQVAEAWRTLTGLFGYRLRAELDADFETLTSALSIAMHGRLVAELGAPDIAGRHITASPYGAPERERCTLSALSVAGVAMTFLEPDPEAEWGEQSLYRIHQAIDTWVG